jgi:hypothetical protein
MRWKRSQVCAIAVMAIGILNRAKADDASTTVKFAYHERCIFVDLQSGNHPTLLFLLDTGATASAIDHKTAEKLQLQITGKTKVEGTAGIIEARTAVVPSLSTGNARVEGIKATVQDLGGSLVPKGRRLDGILGYDFLSSFSLSIDYKSQTLAFSKSPSRVDPVAASVIPFDLEQRIPRFKAKLNDSVVADFRLDTGASLFATKDVYLNIPESVWQSLASREPKPIPKGRLQGASPAGKIELRLAQVDAASFGDMKASKPFVIVQPRVGYFARKDAVGFVSNNLLEKFSPVTIDYLSRRLVLSKRIDHK